MTREVPKARIDERWVVGRQSYATRRAAYVSLARTMILVRYGKKTRGNGRWRMPRFAKRKDPTATRHRDWNAFYSWDNDHARWNELIHRLARHMMKLDDRRGVADELADATDEQLQHAYEQAERGATQLAERAAAIKKLASTRIPLPARQP